MRRCVAACCVQTPPNPHQAPLYSLASAGLNLVQLHVPLGTSLLPHYGCLLRGSAAVRSKQMVVLARHRTKLNGFAGWNGLSDPRALMLVFPPHSKRHTLESLSSFSTDFPVEQGNLRSDWAIVSKHRSLT